MKFKNIANICTCSNFLWNPLIDQVSLADLEKWLLVFDMHQLMFTQSTFPHTNSTLIMGTRIGYKKNQIRFNIFSLGSQNLVVYL